MCEPTVTSQSGGAFWSAAIAAPGGTWPNDQYSQLIIATSAGTETFFLALRQAAANVNTQYLVGFTATGAASTGTLYAFVNGTTHTLTTFSGTINAGNTMTFSAVGNVLTLVNTTTSATIVSFTDTNNYIASGSPGFGLYNVTAIADSQISFFVAGANQAATPTFSPNGGSFGPHKL